VNTRTERLMSRPGFSLIEITAVILLIGILAAGAAVAILPQVARAKVNATKNSMRTVKTGIESYMVANSAAPPPSRPSSPTTSPKGSDQDAWKTMFYYRVTTGSVNPYELLSAGPDKDFNTPEDNIDLWLMDTQE
jgi:prepilin-type N-terminal cleavage/methylation domain-containing protein